jgi:hypothetical protein
MPIGKSAVIGRVARHGGFERPGKFAVTSPMRLDEPPQLSGFWKLKLLNCAKRARRNAGLLFDATGAIRMADDRRGVDADFYLLRRRAAPKFPSRKIHCCLQ